jgi:hypothetical protein
VKGRANYIYTIIVVVILLLSAHHVRSLTGTLRWRSNGAAFIDAKREFQCDDLRFHSDRLALRQLLLRRSDSAELIHRRNLVRLDWNQIVADRAKRANGASDSTVDVARM